MRSSTLLFLFALGESVLAHDSPKSFSSSTSWSSLGCYTGISGENRVSNDRMTVERCFSHCDGYPYAVLSGGRECVCASNMGRKVDSGRCAIQCVGDSGVVCGGWSAGSVYKRESGCGGPAKTVTVTTTETRGTTITVGKTVTVARTVTVTGDATVKTVTIPTTVTVPTTVTLPQEDVTVTVSVPTTLTVPTTVTVPTITTLPEQALTVTVSVHTTVTLPEQAVTVTVSAVPTTITITAHETTSAAASEAFTTSTIIGVTTAPYANTTVTQPAIYTNATVIYTNATVTSIHQTPTPSVGLEGNTTLTSGSITTTSTTATFNNITLSTAPGSSTTASSTVTFNNATLSTTESIPTVSSIATFNYTTLPTTSSVTSESTIYNTTIQTTPTSESTTSTTSSLTPTSESVVTTSSSTTSTLPTPTTPACAPDVSPLVNGGFDTGALTPWVATNNGPTVYAIGGSNHNGGYHATYRQTNSALPGTATLTQQIKVCPGTKYKITAWSQYSAKPNYCTVYVIVDGVTLGTLAPGYNQYVLDTFSVTAEGETAIVAFKMSCATNDMQWLLLDDVAVTLVDNTVTIPA